MKRAHLPWIILIVLVGTIIGVATAWHSRPGRVTVVPLLRVELEGSEFAGTPIFLGDRQIGETLVEEFPLDANADYAIGLPRGWDTKSLIHAVRQRVPKDRAITVVQSMPRRPSEESGGWVDSTSVVLHLTGPSHTIEPVVAIGWRVHAENFAVLVRFEHEWKAIAPEVQVAGNGSTTPPSNWFDDRLTIHQGVSMTLFWKSDLKRRGSAPPK